MCLVEMSITNEFALQDEGRAEAGGRLSCGACSDVDVYEGEAGGIGGDEGRGGQRERRYLVKQKSLTHTSHSRYQQAGGKRSSGEPQLKRSFSLVPERMDGMSSGQIIGRKPLIGLIAQYQRAVVFRLGRLVSKGALGPGLVFVLPCLDTLKRVDLRTFTFDVPTQEILTKDSVTVAVDAVVYYRIFDPVMSVVNVEDANRSTRLLAQTTLRNVLGTGDLSTLLTDQENMAAVMQETLDVATDTWGVKVERVEIKHVRLPTQLQRAMAAEAEATREAKAKVIAAQGEQLASKALKAAAIEISECPIALQLRYLQTLNSISAEKNSTIIFPLPIDILSQYMNRHPREPQPRVHQPLPATSQQPPTLPAKTRSMSSSRQSTIATPPPPTLIVGSGSQQLANGPPLPEKRPPSSSVNRNTRRLRKMATSHDRDYHFYAIDPSAPDEADLTV